MNFVILFFIYAAGVAVAFYLGWKLAIWDRETNAPQAVNPEPSNPQVVVNVPKDYKPLETLDGKEVVVGEKALLWWTVYKHTLFCLDGEIGQSDIDVAIEAADGAVDKVYGV